MFDYIKPNGDYYNLSDYIYYYLKRILYRVVTLIKIIIAYYFFVILPKIIIFIDNIFNSLIINFLKIYNKCYHRYNKVEK